MRNRYARYSVTMLINGYDANYYVYDRMDRSLIDKPFLTRKEAENYIKKFL